MELFSSKISLPDTAIRPPLNLDIFVGRQPIFDRYLRVIGYELLYRSFGANRALFIDGDRATSQVILNSFAEIGIEEIVGNQKLFINLTRNFFLKKYPIPLLPGRLVIEVMENILIDNEILSALRDLSHSGYKIALDDISHPYILPQLLEIADLVKVDLKGIKIGQLNEYVHNFNHTKTKLLAEKVETRAEFDKCMQIGFDYFQGFFLCKPNLVTARHIPTSRLVLLHLLGKIQDPNINFRLIEEIIAQDPTLGYKLLRLTNSVYFGIRTKIESIRQAISLIGLDQIRSWLTLILLVDTNDKPRELTVFAMVRAKMCELLAIAARAAQPERFFLTGLFSSLDAFMDQSMEQILSVINLSDEIVEAILDQEGLLGKALKCTIAYEHAEWEEVGFLDLSSEKIRDIYLESLSWVELTKKTLRL